MGRLTKYPSECGESARFPDYVREYRLWGYFRFSCHTVADDGPLYEEWEIRTSRFLWGNDHGRYRGSDLGGCGYLFLSWERYGRKQCFRHCRCHYEKLVGIGGRYSGDFGCDSCSDYFRRYGFPVGPSDCSGLYGHGTEKYPPPFVYLCPDVSGCYRIVIV